MSLFVFFSVIKSAPNQGVVVPIPRPFWKDFPVYTEPYDGSEDEDVVTTPEPDPEPSFADGPSSNITAQLGGKVVFHCTVINLGDKTVSLEFI